MSKLTAEEFADKQARNLKNAAEDMRLGVERVAVNPMEEAAKKKDKMRANIVKSIDNGKWEAGLKRVSKSDWQDKMIKKGIPRVAQGIDEARPKVVAFASQLLPHIDKGVAEIKNMPDLTLEDSINRMGSFVRHMAKFKRGA